MGACLSSESSEAYTPASSPSSTPGGHKLGGSDRELTPRKAAALAAERRAAAAGPGLERSTKAELVGRLSELYKRQGKEVPFGLGSFSVEKLRNMIAANRER
jgi:hypothetical protein